MIWCLLTLNLMEYSIKQNVNLDDTNLPNVTRATSIC